MPRYREEHCLGLERLDACIVHRIIASLVSQSILSPSSLFLTSLALRDAFGGKAQTETLPSTHGDIVESYRPSTHSWEVGEPNSFVERAMTLEPFIEPCCCRIHPGGGRSRFPGGVGRWIGREGNSLSIWAAERLESRPTDRAIPQKILNIARTRSVPAYNSMYNTPLSHSYPPT